MGRPPASGTSALKAAMEGRRPPGAAGAVGVIEVAALALWVAWWPLGALLAALSRRWSAREKVMAVVIQVAVLVAAGGYLLTPIYARKLSWMLLLGLLSPPLLLDLAGAAYLAWKLASPAPLRWTPGWKQAARVGVVVLGGWLLWMVVIGPALLLVLKQI